MQSKRPVMLIVVSMVIGLLVGLWWGVNIGKHKPIFSNPFAEKSLADRVMESGGEMLEKGGKALKQKAEP